MKSKFVGILLAAVLLMSLCGCSAGDASIEANADTFLVRFQVDCEDEVFGIHFEYYLDGDPAGGGLTGNANGSALKTGEVLTKDFIPADFPEEADLSQFQLEIFLVDEQGQEHPCTEALRFGAAYGHAYDIIITGSYKAGFSADKK